MPLFSFFSFPSAADDEEVDSAAFAFFYLFAFAARERLVDLSLLSFRFGGSVRTGAPFSVLGTPRAVRKADSPVDAGLCLFFFFFFLLLRGRGWTTVASVAFFFLRRRGGFQRGTGSLFFCGRDGARRTLGAFFLLLPL